MHFLGVVLSHLASNAAKAGDRAAKTLLVAVDGRADDSEGDVCGRAEVVQATERRLLLHEDLAPDADAAVHEMLRLLQILLPEELVETVPISRSIVRLRIDIGLGPVPHSDRAK